jgi:hypothetical protein
MSSQEKEVLKTKLCCACEKEKPVKQFYKCKLFIDGYMSRCKSCRAKHIRCNLRKSRTTNESYPELSLHGVSRNDFIQTFRFLEKIGYSLQENIHKQFCERHNLPTKKKIVEKGLRFTPEELGLI